MTGNVMDFWPMSILSSEKGEVHPHRSPRLLAESLELLAADTAMIPGPGLRGSNIYRSATGGWF